MAGVNSEDKTIGRVADKATFQRFGLPIQSRAG